MAQLCCFRTPVGGVHLGAVIDGRVYDLTASGRPAYATLAAWLAAADTHGLAVAMAQLHDHTQQLPVAHDWTTLQQPPAAGQPLLQPPIDRQEVWAAGVTYLRSRAAREAESAGSGIYDRVYVADRPEIFFKATPHRVVGPHDDIYIRADAQWNVPEPELTVVLTPGLQVAGYTAGNDVSSRDIEGANPLYLPQAKLYDRACALGPAITLAADMTLPATIRLTINRGDDVVFTAEISTAQMKRTVDELVTYLGRANRYPSGVFLMTGTGIVPPDDFTLAEDDHVVIEIVGIGRLINRVRRSPG